jgi:hypothetical protein
LYNYRYDLTYEQALSEHLVLNPLDIKSRINEWSEIYALQLVEGDSVQ